MRVLFIRHASTQPDRDTPSALWPLTEAVRRDAVHLADTLPPVAEVYASLEPKALATGQPLASRHGLQVRTLSGLGELQRPWTGGQRIYEEAVERCFAFPAASAAPEWETATAALARFSAAIDQICTATTAAEVIAVVSHGLVLSLYRARLLTLPAPDFAAWRALPFPAWAVADVNAGQLLQDFAGLCRRGRAWWAMPRSSFASPQPQR